jgi:hypothetical protein
MKTVSVGRRPQVAVILLNADKSEKPWGYKQRLI